MPKTLEEIEQEQVKLTEHVEAIKAQLAGVNLNPKEIADLKSHLANLEQRLETVSIPHTNPEHHCHWCG